MDHGHMGGMASPPSPPSSTMNGSNGMMHHEMMMHMTFFWGTNAQVLFSKWPGSSTGMYYVCLLFVFALAVIVEWLSHCRLIKAGSSDVVCGLAQTFLHAIRVGLAYMVMLAVMSFNVGVFLVAVAGHTVGFLLFGSRVFKKPDPEDEKGSDLPPMSC
ncbi:copper transporter 6 [Prunus yedoensis var. nudiflora]|uniref:Copper transport protein n=1 Tax=Prunus yedoensis var. nudiflora TaxID=2094558 RepID=A0A314Y7L2_PRUYE|nr:copper transporter 6 [Prunus yedoensis var. nudiflora]